MKVSLLAQYQPHDSAPRLSRLTSTALRLTVVLHLQAVCILAFLGLLALSAPANARQLQQAQVTDADLLNFALNLEVSDASHRPSFASARVLHQITSLFCRTAAPSSALCVGSTSSAVSNTICALLQCLEGHFYHCAVYGTPLRPEITGNGPAPIGCQAANFSNDDIFSLAQDVANNEEAHVAYLRTALGSAAVSCPLVNIGSAFSAAANAALNTTLSPPFSPYVNDLFFLHGAFIFEDVGVTAYKGALNSFQSADIRLAAAGEHFCLVQHFTFTLWHLLGPANALSLS